MLLALVADGGLDGTFCVENRIWDVAAGVLLIEEAGGVITDLEGNSLSPFDLSADPQRMIPFLAASPPVHKRLLSDMQ